MTKDRAILLVRKLRRLSAGAGTEGEAETSRMQASKLQEKFSITEAELADASSEKIDSTDIDADEMTIFLKDFERQLRVDLLVAGRKRGRFTDHPHAERILAARQRKMNA